ncbi:MAG TPA: plastocyanin/azurin family copper-binding protein [Acidimicrobiales bacterium]|nr:plastocyanin/azurin family copper-binding protein [Acidimicrobiales bacterium]
MHTGRLALAIAAAATLIAATAACGSSGATTTPPVAGAAVKIAVFHYDPSPLTVKAGTRITWTNTDQILHTVTSGTRDHPDGRFDGRLDGVGSSFSVRLTTPGTYQYHCSRHPGMDASIVVEP